jgi:hypothetical protein
MRILSSVVYRLPFMLGPFSRPQTNISSGSKKRGHVKLNRRLHDGELHTRLVDWLNSLPEVQAILKTDFEERPVSEQNLSEWKQGGYSDWVLQQEALDLVRHMDADADELNQASKVRLTDLLTQRLAAGYVIAAKALGRSNEEGEIDLKILRELCGDIVALRKGDHSAERLKLERERLDFERDQLRELREEEFWEWAREHRDEICEGYLSREERMDRVRKILFGVVAEGAATPEVGAEPEPPQ